jgi:type IV secretory pathway protease TraF
VVEVEVVLMQPPLVQAVLVEAWQGLGVLLQQGLELQTKVLRVVQQTVEIITVQVVVEQERLEALQLTHRRETAVLE